MGLTVEDLAEAYAQTLGGYAEPDVIVAYPEGTWLLQSGREPALLGEAGDFDGIMWGWLRSGFSGKFRRGA